MNFTVVGAGYVGLSLAVLISQKFRVNLIDITIILVFLVGFVIFGWFQGRGNISSKDYFLGNQSLPWVVAMFSIVATETSVLTFISVPGLAYRGDWIFLQLSFDDY